MLKAAMMATSLSVTSGVAISDDFAAPMQEYFETQVAHWYADPMIVAAIRAQNARNAGLRRAQVLQLDTQWRAEIGQSETPTITPVITGSSADFLRDQVANSGGIISEIFIMDAHGLNVAATGPTSDYWQGDEAKFIETFGRGAGAIHVADVEFDESASVYQGQISAPIVDPVTHAVIGAITIGLNAGMLF
ncbi:hypothetical protein A9Q95_04330 [Rhodobacterales bacterium 59_46_T64]|nr:hypothetical protein A9Q95_04330 [Rhodobacterales bacterium 59_46_T64]